MIISRPWVQTFQLKNKQTESRNIWRICGRGYSPTNHSATATVYFYVLFIFILTSLLCNVWQDKNVIIFLFILLVYFFRRFILSLNSTLTLICTRFHNRLYSRNFFLQKVNFRVQKNLKLIFSSYNFNIKIIIQPYFLDNISSSLVWISFVEIF